MITLAEQIEQLKKFQFRTALLRHLVEHIDETFRPVAGQKPKMVLLTDEKIPVPDDVLDGFVAELLQELEKVQKTQAGLLGSGVQLTPPAAPPPAPAPEPVGAPPAAAPPAAAPMPPPALAAPAAALPQAPVPVPTAPASAGAPPMIPVIPAPPAIPMPPQGDKK